MQLEILHPEVAHRDCEHCQQYLYDEETGAPKRQETTGQLVRRIAANPPPCREVKGRKLRGCPKGTPEKPNALTPKNRAAYRHFLRCEALRRFPADGIVERNAGLIALGRDLAAKQQAWLTKRHHENLQTLLATAIKIRTI